MIRIEGIKNTELDRVPYRLQCKNCFRHMPTLTYTLNDITFELCEDCACAMSNLFFLTMENCESHEYDRDEIKCIVYTEKDFKRLDNGRIISNEHR